MTDKPQTPDLTITHNGADTVVVRFTNSDTTVANTVTVAEIEVVAVFDVAVLVAADII